METVAAERYVHCSLLIHSNFTFTKHSMHIFCAVHFQIEQNRKESEYCVAEGRR